MATATRTPTTTRATTIDAKARSIELAQAKGQTACSHAARTLGWTTDEQSGALVSMALSIHSAHDDTEYAVGYSASSDDAQCDCAAAQHGGRPCWHRGVALLIGRYVARRAALGWPED